MPKFSVERAIFIQAPVEKTFALLTDFKQWSKWSPWLVLEPDAEVKVAEDGMSYSWKGSRIGEGSMHKVKAVPPKELYIDLNFLKPFKSEAKVLFTVKPSSNGSEVIWHMDSSLPFYLFFLKNMMIAFLGMDFKRGLQMLKDLAESDTVPSKTEFSGINAYPGCRYVGVSTKCKIDEIGPSMEADFAKLQQWKKSSEVKLGGHGLSIYHHWNLPKGLVSYTSAFPVEQMPASIPDDFVTGSIPSMETYSLTHIGPYRHLGNSWSAGMNLMRAKVFKKSKKTDPFETYETMPGEVDEKDLRTKIWFPIK